MTAAQQYQAAMRELERHASTLPGTSDDIRCAVNNVAYATSLFTDIARAAERKCHQLAHTAPNAIISSRYEHTARAFIDVRKNARHLVEALRGVAYEFNEFYMFAPNHRHQ